MAVVSAITYAKENKTGSYDVIDKEFENISKNSTSKTVQRKKFRQTTKDKTKCTKMQIFQSCFKSQSQLTVIAIIMKLLKLATKQLRLKHPVFPGSVI